MQGLHRAPPCSNVYGPYGMIVVCRYDLWPAVKMELRQEGRLKQLVAKVVAKTASKEDLLWLVIRDHVRIFLCSETSLTGNPVSEVWMHPPGFERPPRWEANSSPVRKCTALRNEGAPPKCISPHLPK